MKLPCTFSFLPRPVLLLISATGLMSVAAASEFIVEMTDNYRFDPSYLQIQLGDTVTWVNQDSNRVHSAYGTQFYWDTGDLSYGQTYSITLPATGKYPYQDFNDWYRGMTGTIVVVVAPVLTDPKRLPDGMFQFTVTNLVVGKTNIVRASTNLLNWTDISTNVAVDKSYSFVDPGAAVIARRYYRVVALP
jgi:plastocyanin